MKIIIKIELSFHISNTYKFENKIIRNILKQYAFYLIKSVINIFYHFGKKHSYSKIVKQIEFQTQTFNNFKNCPSEK